MGTAGNRAALGTIIGLAVCMGGATASAQEWKLESNISQQVLYSDNLLLSRDREIETVGFIPPGAAPGAQLATSQIAFDGRFELADTRPFRLQLPGNNMRISGRQAIESAPRSGFLRLPHDTTTRATDITGRFSTFDRIRHGTSRRVCLAYTVDDCVRALPRDHILDTGRPTTRLRSRPDFSHQRNNWDRHATIGATASSG